MRFFIALVLAPVLVFAQNDTLPTRQLADVVITATRTERTLGALPMPVSLIDRSQIRALGSVRLNDVLAEQTGLVVVPQVNAQGNGLQLQGLNPDYTLILIDGEPLIGRSTGSLELSRLTVGNIKQIEIVKGPSSSLYGSEALAGVVNIITERPTRGMRGEVSTRYGSNQSLDANASVSAAGERAGLYVFFNRFQTSGYDLSPENFGKTISPFQNLTANAKGYYQITPRTELTLAGRYFREIQDFQFEVQSNGDAVRTLGEGFVRDWNINPVLTHRATDRLKLTARYYQTGYATDSRLVYQADGSLYYTDDFRQTFARPEAVAEFFINERNAVTAGAGWIHESVETSRYNDSGTRFQQTAYAFFQHEWDPRPSLSVITGGRFDRNSIYGSQFSPKLSARWAASDRWAFKVSGGVGFKAPDFRQLYLNFSNAAGGGYSVFGTEVARERLGSLQAQGQIETFLFDLNQIGNLQAERSIALNVGTEWKPLARLVADVNFFHNSINNLIETQAVAVTTNNQTIYSYRNIQRAFTQGLELNLTYPVRKQLHISGGYQLLFAKDKDVRDEVRNGNVFWRDPNTFVTRRLRPSEYVGLYNRSRHQGTLKLFYEHTRSGWEGNLRLIYRGRFGVGDIRGNIQGEIIPPSDRNSNNILDVYDDFVPGYILMNVAVAKKFKGGLRTQVGIDNVLDHTEPVFIPNLPGRLWYASVQYSFELKKKNNL